MERASGRGGGGPAVLPGYPSAPMLYTVLSVLQVFIAVGVIFLILLHSGKDAGMSGAFGVGTAGGSTGGSLMERNLDRWTIIFSILFVANTIALLKL
jgi:preprotein translocase subunit SecG